MNTMQSLKAKSLITTVAADLRTGDICAGNGFVVTEGARPSGLENRVLVSGYFPDNLVAGTAPWKSAVSVSVYREV